MAKVDKVGDQYREDNRIVKVVKPYQMIHKASFVRGFNDALNKLPYDHEYYNKLGGQDQCLYEQGRHFSYYYKGPLKVGKKVPHAVERFFVNSFIEKVCV